MIESQLVFDIRGAVEREVERAVGKLFSEELTDGAKELIIRCPQLINRLAANLDKMIDNFDEPLNPVEIAHTTYTMEQLGYEK